MTIVSINTFNIGSTGKIMLNIGELARLEGHNYYFCVPKSRDNCKVAVKNQIFIGNRLSRNIDRLLSIFTGMEGNHSKISTRILLRKLNKLKPEILHLHNLHGWYINIPMLFKYIKKHNIKVIWTLHDCWSFTGRCPYFDMIGCENWISGCGKCQYTKNSYPAVKIDRTNKLWRLKKEWFNGIKDLTIVTPSIWLAKLVEKSFLKNYKIQTINNGIDLTVFRPTDSDFKNRYSCAEKYVILGVAFGWGKRKGLDVFIELASKLDERYKIILVGTDEQVEKQLPENIISIRRTQNQVELAQIYTAADLFVNPTREDNFPTVNIEALACGTPVITFNTGGSPEAIDETCGSVVAMDDMQSLELTIRNACENSIFTTESCLIRAKQFEKDEKFKEYIKLYSIN